MSLTIELPAELETRLKELADREGKAPEQFVAGLIRDRANTKKSESLPLSTDETRLFEVINRGFSDEFWKKLQELDQKRRAAILTEAERLELIEMTEQMEAVNLDRMKALSVLAELQETDIDTLMLELGLSHGEHS